MATVSIRCVACSAVYLLMIVAIAAYLFTGSGKVATPCQGYLGDTNRTRCESRLATFDHHCVAEQRLMPYWLAAASACSKAVVSMLVFGPPSSGEEVSRDTVILSITISAAFKYNCKIAFQSCLLALCIYTWIVDITQVYNSIAAWADGKFGFPLACTSLIATTSTNFSTGLAGQAFFGVYSGGEKWRWLHTDHPDATSEGAAEATKFHMNACNADYLNSVGMDSTMQLFRKYQTPVANAYLALSYVVFAYGAFIYGAFFAIGSIMYIWLFIVLSAALDPFAGALREIVFYLYKKTSGRPEGHVELTSEDPGQEADLGTERKRTILMKMAGKLPLVPTLALDSKEAVETNYADNLEIAKLTGAPRDDWSKFFFFTIIGLIVFPVFTYIGVRFVVALDVRSLSDVYGKVIHPLFHTGPEWSVLKGAYMETVSAAFWARNVQGYWASLTKSLKSKIGFLNSFI
eukprot:TRINITY_DN13023_c0_g2_i4.p1 TRINITY_DN13023_c0_g2~~TRINITY_DN13023_c0_g2_i4.p1  ORF type:complete len:461 (-),score=36.23 TRINITY_DN13023_c0_g2_i4:534-1916(-)